ncbi:MAG: 2-oxoacid:ferredoxin oxidoreductase subunit beta [Planctomycetota bacterium]|nr:2-oxoacid:ferredoxin oxidoreductase subunit beta [Planctomycetota bacterium]
MPAITASKAEKQKFTKADFQSNQEVRWCPGCGDYAILTGALQVFAGLGIPRENFVMVSGIGCSSRFPYYVNTYGFHTIHGRAPAVATGVKLANPELQVWVITGDGDGMSIGGNHLMHALRRNLDIKILMFNNRIYGLTKGQYSPTSEYGKVTKSTPFGSVDQPVNPVSFALASEATFVARTADIYLPHLQSVLNRAAEHKGVAFIEILQNCVIFNDGAFKDVTERSIRDDENVLLEDGKPMIFGKGRKKGLRLKGLSVESVELGQDGVTEKDLLVHDQRAEDQTLAYMLSRLDHPTVMGIFRDVTRPSFERRAHEQVQNAKERYGEGDLLDLIRGKETWTIK